MKYNSFFKLFLFAFICVFMAASCTTKEGPMGANGENGVNGENGLNGINGTNGTDGKDGVDGNMSCLVCHTQAGMDALTALYNQSGHAAALNVSYAGGRASCSPCHSNELYLNALNNAPGVDAIDIAYPTAISCATCHANHQSLEDDITAPMTTVEAVVGAADGTILDFGGPANLCANCHQARRTGDSYIVAEAKTYKRTFTGDAIESYKHAAVGPAGSMSLNATEDTLTVVFDVPTTHVYVNSEHAGPHHGPQANTLLGYGGYGTTSKGAHAAATCTGCHMGEVEGNDGGHSFNPSVAACNKCHADATDFNINGKLTAFATRYDAVQAALEEVGALHGGHPMYASLEKPIFEAWWNFMMLYEDHSNGVHNPNYFDTLLTNAETALGL